MQRLLSWFWHRFRPQEGWFSLLLLTSMVACLVWALAAASWVPEENVVVVTGLLGLLLGTVLAKRPLHPLAAWLLLTVYGLLVTTVHLASLWPPLRTLVNGWPAMTLFWRNSGALFLDRSVSWLQAATSGGRSEETIIFALGLGLLVWFLAAFAGWCTYRIHRPLLAILLLGTAVVINSYYDPATLIWVSVYVGLASLAAAFIHFAGMEREWQASSTDYSTEIRFELTLQASLIALLLMLFSFIIPAFNLARISEFLLRQPAVQELEETWERVFGGVADAPGGPGSRLSAPGGSGLLPRSYLLGNAPELSETLMMEATLWREEDGRLLPVTNVTGLHWRALSYVDYTGRGWTRSEERLENVDANEPIALPEQAGQSIFRQAVDWRFDNRIIRYTVGFPLAFDHPVEVAWRGLEDLVRVYGEDASYEGITRLATADAESLRATRIADVPPALLARYAALPDTVPERVTSLAQDVAGNLDNPYDQALALESFLRQYEYSLDVDSPPVGADVVDYFLFDLQRGYCDYYASSMVVMARALGLPARIAVGFLAQPPDEDGKQQIYQINGHSWAEIYFAGYGWVEFEPTAPFPTSSGQSATARANPRDDRPPEFDQLPAPLPESDSAQPEGSRWRWLRFAIVGAAALLVFTAWWRQRRAVPQDLTASYGRFRQQAQQLGTPSSPALTPFEFQARFFDYLTPLENAPRLQALVRSLRRPVIRLTEAYVRHQYRAPQPESETAVLEDTQSKLHRPLRRLQIAHRLRTWLRRMPVHSPDPQAAIGDQNDENEPSP